MSTTRWLTTAQVATVCQVSPSTVRSWIRRGHLTRAPDGTLDARAVLAYLDRQEQNEPVAAAQNDASAARR